MTSDAAEVPASINKKHLDILQGIPDGWILRYCTYANKKILSNWKTFEKESSSKVTMSLLI